MTARSVTDNGGFSNRDFRAGKEALTSGNYTRAIKLFEASCRDDDSQVTFRAYRAWAQYLEARDERVRTGSSGNDRWLRSTARKNASRQLRTLSEGHPMNDELQVFVGRMHLDEGQRDPAIKYFQRALRLNPRNDSAQRYLTLAERRTSSTPAASSDGVVKRISDWWRARS